MFGTTLWFALMGGLAVGTVRAHLAFAVVPPALCWIIHCATIVGTNWLAGFLLEGGARLVWLL